MSGGYKDKWREHVDIVIQRTRMGEDVDTAGVAQGVNKLSVDPPYCAGSYYPRT